MLIYAAFAVDPTGRIGWGWNRIANLLLPVAVLSYILAFFMKPLVKARKRLILHFIQTGIVCELLGAMAYARLNDMTRWAEQGAKRQQ
jgi:hypothetical protein